MRVSTRPLKLTMISSLEASQVLEADRLVLVLAVEMIRQ
jgi:hypothetical protein